MVGRSLMVSGDGHLTVPTTSALIGGFGACLMLFRSKILCQQITRPVSKRSTSRIASVRCLKNVENI